MQTSKPAISTHKEPLPIPAGLWSYAEECTVQTAAAIQDAQAASPVEISHAMETARANHAAGKPSDLLIALLHIRGHDEEHLGAHAVELGNRISAVLFHPVPLIPFGGKLITPNAFYESFPQLHQLARVLLSPVIFAEDADSIGTASINPIASALLAAEIETAVFERSGIRPFLSTSRLDYESWTFLTRRHFES